MAQQTRHGLYGGPRPVYGSFAGKAEVVSVVPDVGPVHTVSWQSVVETGWQPVINVDWQPVTEIN
jgi:hypothetical protein